MAGNIWNGWKWLKIAGMAENSWNLLEMADVLEWPEMAGNYEEEKKKKC